MNSREKFEDWFLSQNPKDFKNDRTLQDILSMRIGDDYWDDYWDDKNNRFGGIQQQWKAWQAALKSEEAS